MIKYSKCQVQDDIIANMYRIIFDNTTEDNNGFVATIGYNKYSLSKRKNARLYINSYPCSWSFTQKNNKSGFVTEIINLLYNQSEIVP